MRRSVRGSCNSRDRPPCPKRRPVRGLVACYDGTDDVRVGRFLATIVHDEAESEMCRLAAYDALYSLRGTVPPVLPAVREGPPRLPRIPDELDWSFVDSFLEVGRIPRPVATVFDVTVANLREPERTAAWLFGEGCTAYERGDYASAVEIFTRSINTVASQAGVYIMRGGAFVKLGKLDDAIWGFHEGDRTQTPCAQGLSKPCGGV